MTDKAIRNQTQTARAAERAYRMTGCPVAEYTFRQTATIRQQGRISLLTATCPECDLHPQPIFNRSECACTSWTEHGGHLSYRP